MLQKIQRQRKIVVVVCITLITTQLFIPYSAFALTSGPSQPEFSGFSEVNTSDMVNLFTGDLNYNIPLFDLPGPGGSYPFTLSYNSGITMDQEASWVGLGWTLNAGAINREMRGLPDEFNGDEVTTLNDLKPNVTWEYGVKGDVELIAVPEGINDTFGRIPLSLGITFTHNSYMGWDAGGNLGISLRPFNSSAFSLSAGVQTSAFEGANLNTGFSLADYHGNVTSQISLGANINGREGLMGLNLDCSYSYQKQNAKTNKIIYTTGGNSLGVSFARRSFIPANDVRYRGGSFDGTIEVGIESGLPHSGGRVNISKSEQEIENRNIPQTFRSYGYLHSKQRHRGDNFLTDINRMNDGPIHPFTQNLAIPNTTPDLFNVSASGLSTQFRPFRSDVGIYSDPSILSLYTDLNVGADINPGGYADLGISLGAKIAGSFNDIWPTQGLDLNNFNFSQEIDNSDYRTVYFKVPGELTGDLQESNNFFAKDDTVKVGLNKMNVDASSVLESDRGKTYDISTGARSTRKPEATSIQYITNGELLSQDGSLSRSEYTVWIYQDGDRVELDRSSDSLHHIAGFEILNSNGLRYIYALPVKNLEHREYVFSVTKPENECAFEVDANNQNDYLGTNNQYFQMKELPEYAHSHLLTAVLGQDYEDVDDIPGPSDGDIGFWVRFEYERTPDYKWRAPYSGANYIRGIPLTDRDDKASFVYGVREQYYLRFAETRTHRAEFISDSTRLDAFGANHEFGEPVLGVHSKKLTDINLYSKANPSTSITSALKRIHFTQDYNLCRGIPNAEENAGKLTLTQVSFSYENSTEGAQHGYTFMYNESYGPEEDQIPFDYNTRHQDRWGRYHLPENDCEGIEYPYTVQDSVKANDWAKAWQLKSIILPSGAKIDIDYESDDYMFVQDKPAMQMFKVTGVDAFGVDQITNQESSGNPFKIFFEPLRPVESESDIIPYLKGIHGLKLDDMGNILPENQSQVYFKANMELKNGLYDFISGYAKIVGYGIMDDQPYISIAPYQFNHHSYHPFCAGAWEKMKLEYPHLMSTKEFEDENQSFREVIGLFASAISQIGSLYKHFFTTCDNQDIAHHIDLDLSRIRLTNPGLRKFGGNSRVSKIMLTDNWEDITTYGQTYDYTMIDEEGKRISSGVAENEPMVGFEECTLRYAEIYPDQIPIQTREGLMFEYPVNDAYLPGPNVGYRKVTVRSLAGSMLSEPESGLPSNFGTTGYTEHEFYTAKDFPILFGNTELEHHFPYKAKWAAFFGINRSDSYTGSQGYAITLNDMHGKPMSVTHYGQDKNNRDQDQMVNRTTYSYFEGDTILTQQLGNYQKVRTLKNDLPALMEYAPDPDPEMGNKMFIRNLEFGVDREFFVDMRRARTEATSVKFDVNIVFTPLVSIFGLPIPLPGGFGAVQQADNETRTVVANKVIYKTGILKEIDVYDGQSHLKTNQLLFDKITGQSILTSVNNAFDDLIYSFQLPAHYAYDGMSAAYTNYRTHFTAQIGETDNCTGWNALESVPEEVIGLLKMDDELLILDGSEVLGTFTINQIQRDEGGDVTGILGVPSAPISGEYNFVLLRSGARNLLTADALALTSLTDPTQNITPTTDEISVITPEDNLTIDLDYLKVNNVLNAQATVYDRTAALENNPCMEPPEPVLTCGCYGADIECDGGCLGLVYLMVHPQDTLVAVQALSDYCSYEGGPNTINVDFGYVCFPEEGTLYLDFPTGDCEFESENYTINSEECAPRPAMLLMDPPVSEINTGHRWESRNAFTYIADREGYVSATNMDIDISTSGIINDLPLFNFENPFFATSAVGQNWVSTQFTNISNLEFNKQETIDAIGVSTTIVTGYPQHMSMPILSNLPIIVAKNATPYEVAFEGFEEDNWIASNPPMTDMSTGGFTFRDDMMQPFRTEKYQILGGISGAPHEVAVMKQFDSDDGAPVTIILNLDGINGDRRSIQICDVGESSEAINISELNEFVISPFESATKYEIDWPTLCPNLNGPYTGSALLIFPTVSHHDLLVSMRSDMYSHTGNFSFHPTITGEGKSQYLLNLISGKKYVLEGWIHIPELLPVNLYPNEAYIYLSCPLVDCGSAIPIGNIIEGWQRIYGQFTAEGSSLRMTFLDNIEGKDIYYDDIRISPLDADIKTYVYDPKMLRLVAELDQNNFATLYSYDQEGKLVLIRKETERGIMSIQESRSHLKIQ